MKKIILSLTLVISLLLGTLSVGCGDGLSKDDLNIHIYNAGYGIDWLTEMGKDYFNITGQKVVVRKAVDTATDVEKLQVDRNSYDLLFLVTDLSRMARDKHIKDLTDLVYNKNIPVYNADGTINQTATAENITVKESLGNLTGGLGYDFNNDSKMEYYTLPYASSISSLLYNKTTLDYIFGEEEYDLPRTTDEFTAMLNSIKNSDKPVYGMVSAADYMEYLVDVWWAQYDGIDGYMNYWKGYTVDGTASENEPLMAKAGDNGRKYALEYLQSIFTKDTGYLHKDTSYFFAGKSDAWVRGQKSFTYNIETGEGNYYNEKKGIAFYPCGDWFEHEMGESNMFDCDVRAMKVPVISAIGDKLGITDEVLCQCIDYVDGVTSEKPQFTSTKELTVDQVIESVASARNLVSSNYLLSSVCIPVNCEKTDVVADFLLYMISDRGQKIFASFTNGITMPYGFDLDGAVEDQDDNDPMYIEVSDFADSFNKINNSNVKYVYRDITKQLTAFGDLPSFAIELGNYRYTKPIYDGDDDASSIITKTYNMLNRNWNTIKGFVGK